jgi:hypothetical protein
VTPRLCRHPMSRTAIMDMARYLFRC